MMPPGDLTCAMGSPTTPNRRTEPSSARWRPACARSISVEELVARQQGVAEALPGGAAGFGRCGLGEALFEFSNVAERFVDFGGVRRAREGKQVGALDAL